MKSRIPIVALFYREVSPELPETKKRSSIRKKENGKYSYKEHEYRY
jgi:hypothetical protein